MTFMCVPCIKPFYPAHRRFVATILLILSLVLFFGGGCSKERQNNDAWLGEGPFPETFLLITKPSRRHGFTTDQQVLDVRGILVGDAESLSYVLTSGDSSNAQGDLPVSPHWQLTEMLLEGDNDLVVEGIAGNGVAFADSVVITYNPLVSLGTASATPTEVFRGQGEVVTFHLPILDYSGGSIQGVWVIEVDSDRQPMRDLAGANDDGLEADELAGDGVFTASATLDASAEVERTFRFVVEVVTEAGVRKQHSEILRLRVFEPLTTADLQAVVDQHRLVADKYDTYHATLDRGPALSRVAQDLRGLPLVISTSVGSSSTALWWRTLAGLRCGFTTAMAEDTQPPATADSPAAGRRKNGGIPCVSEAQAILLDPFATQEARYPITGLLKTILEGGVCPQYEVKRLAGSRADVDAFKHLDQYGIVFVNTHGNKSGVIGADEVWFMTGQVFEPAAYTNVFHPYFKDLKADRLSYSSHEGDPNLYWAIYPEFIYYYNRSFPEHSLVYFASCMSAAGESLARSFLMAGAEAYLGYTGNVSSAYGQCMAKVFFEEWIIRGRLLSKSLAEARRGCGTSDPTKRPGATRLVRAPPDAELNGIDDCDGFASFEDTGDWGGDGYEPKHHSYTHFVSRDKITRAWWDPTGNTLILSTAELTCQAEHSTTDLYGEVTPEYRAAGARSDIYPDLPDNPADLDLDARYGVIKLEIHPETQSVRIYMQPEAPYRSDDEWVDADVRGFDGEWWSEKWTTCPFEGAMKEFGLYFDISEPDVIITDDRVEADTVFQNEWGSVRIRFRYRLKND